MSTLMDLVEIRVLPMLKQDMESIGDKVMQIIAVELFLVTKTVIVQSFVPPNKPSERQLIRDTPESTSIRILTMSEMPSTTLPAIKLLQQTVISCSPSTR